jgi:hypothetical protein
VKPATKAIRPWQRVLGMGLAFIVSATCLPACSNTPPPAPAAISPDDGKDAKPVVPKKAKLPKA